MTKKLHLVSLLLFVDYDPVTVFLIDCDNMEHDTINSEIPLLCNYVQLTKQKFSNQSLHVRSTLQSEKRSFQQS